jgi:hypothetical protein
MGYMQYALLAFVIVGLSIGIVRIQLKNRPLKVGYLRANEEPTLFRVPVQIKYRVNGSYWSLKTASWEELIIRESTIEVSLRPPLKADSLAMRWLFSSADTTFEMSRIRSSDWIVIRGVQAGTSSERIEVAIRNRRHTQDIWEGLLASGARPLE